jgi:hypothetical protein
MLLPNLVTAPSKMKKLASAVVALLAAITSPAFGQTLLDYVAWEPSGPGAFTSSTAGISGSIAFSTAGDDNLFRNDLISTSLPYIVDYGSVVQAVKFDSGAEATAGSAMAQVQFSQPLPTGARLLAYDVDVGGRDEQLRISQSGGSLVLLEQRESRAGETSLFPSWSSPSGLLEAQGAGANNEEVTVFDISGVQSLTVEYAVGARVGAGAAGASFAIGVPVPEPGSAALTALGLVAIVASRTSRRRRRLLRD